MSSVQKAMEGSVWDLLQTLSHNPPPAFRNKYVSPRTRFDLQYSRRIRRGHCSILGNLELALLRYNFFRFDEKLLTQNQPVEEGLGLEEYLLISLFLVSPVTVEEGLGLEEYS